VVRAGRREAGLLEGAGYLSIAASPMVMGTGLFVLLFPVADPVALALPVTALVNAAMSLPFVLRALVPAMRALEADYGRLADSLGMTGRARLRLVTLPRLRRPLGFAAGLAAALSMGDLGVIALFAEPGGATLPLQLYRLMAAYRMDEAAGAALLLLGLSLALFWLFDRGGRRDADAG
jgi:thiamine transport system permease protein